VVPCSLSGHGRSGASGLGDLLAISTVPVRVLPVCGAVVDKERGDAYHLIDIQEDVGLNFKGVGDQDVERSMRYEKRDQQLKNDWVQGEGYQ
jgi:hypothetical protein